MLCCCGNLVQRCIFDALHEWQRIWIQLLLIPIQKLCLEAENWRNSTERGWKEAGDHTSTLVLHLSMEMSSQCLSCHGWEAAGRKKRSSWSFQQQARTQVFVRNSSALRDCRSLLKNELTRSSMVMHLTVHPHVTGEKSSAIIGKTVLLRQSSHCCSSLLHSSYTNSKTQLSFQGLACLVIEKFFLTNESGMPRTEKHLISLHNNDRRLFLCSFTGLSFFYPLSLGGMFNVRWGFSTFVW